MGQEAMTIKNFIKEHGLTVEWFPLYQNPNITDMPKGSVHFTAVVASGGRTLHTPYSCGPGIVESWARETKFKAVVDGRTITSELLAKRYNQRHPAKYEFLRMAALEFRPEFEDLLDCLASDASCIDSARDFSDFCDELGYNDDSIKDRKTYDTIKEQTRELEQLLGKDALQILMYEVERP
jgi:hypothetical protein